MTALAGSSAASSAGTAWRRLLVVSLRRLEPAHGWVLALSASVVLSAAWLLMSPPTLLSKVMTQDLLFNLSGAWQVHLGRQPHVDFHEPSGRLSFLLTALGFKIIGPVPQAFLVNVAIVTALLFAASFLAAVRRLPLLPAVLFIAFVCLLALMPSNVGDRPDQYTFAMSYNRYCWAAFCVLTLILFVPPLQRRRFAIDLAVSAGLLLLLFHLKITYFLAGVAAVGFAVLFHLHIRSRWIAWTGMAGLLCAYAISPRNHPYLDDILTWSTSGAIRVGLAQHFGNFFAASGLYAVYLAAIAVAGWMWAFGRASFRFPLTLAFLFVVSIGLLTQNSQTVGLPTGIVMLLILYDQLRRHFALVRNRDIAPLLLTLLVFPLFELGCAASSLIGYHADARRDQGLHVVSRTNLRDLAVPNERQGAFLSFSRTFDYPAKSAGHEASARYQLTEHEFVLALLEAADLLERKAPGGIALFDSVNPLPFMLGWETARGSNLWTTWNAPVRPADEYLGDVDYVLVPKFSLNPRWTEDLLRLYGDYVESNFTVSAESRCWTLLARTPRIRPEQERLQRSI